MKGILEINLCILKLRGQSSLFSPSSPAKLVDLRIWQFWCGGNFGEKTRELGIEELKFGFLDLVIWALYLLGYLSIMYLILGWATENI